MKALPLLLLVATSASAQVNSTLNISGGMALTYPGIGASGDYGAALCVGIEHHSGISEKLDAMPLLGYSVGEYRVREADVYNAATFHDFTLGLGFNYHPWATAERDGINFMLGPGMSYALSPHYNAKPATVGIAGIGYRYANEEVRLRMRYAFSDIVRGDASMEPMLLEFSVAFAIN